MENVEELKIPGWRQGYPTESYLPYTLADTGGVWCATCLEYIEPPAYFAIGNGSICNRNRKVNKHHPIQSSWASGKLPELKSKRSNARINSVSDIYGVPVHCGCHKKLEDRQAQSLGYTLDTYFFDGSPKTALRLLHDGHVWAAFAACWHILNVIKPLDPDVDAKTKDILLQAASAAVSPWEPDPALIIPQQGTAPGWEAALSFRAAIHCAAHGLRRSAQQYLRSGEEHLLGRSTPPWVAILHQKARAEVLQDLGAAHIVALQTPSISRRQFEAALRFHKGLPAENHFRAIDESLASAEFSFWHFRARQEHFYGILNENRRDKKQAYMKYVRAQYIYCRLGLQFPFHIPLLQDLKSSVPGYAMLDISFSNNRKANRRKLYSLRIKAIKESGLLAQLRDTFDIRKL